MAFLDIFVKNELQKLKLRRLANDLVHLVSPCFEDEFFFCVAGTGNNTRLWQPICPNIISNFVGGFVAVHDGHGAVHKN